MIINLSKALPRACYISRRSIYLSRISYNNQDHIIKQVEKNVAEAKNALDDLISKAHGREDVHGENAIDFNDPSHLSQTLDRLRVVPKERSFYMSDPPHEEMVRTLTDMLNKNINLPIRPNYQRPAWISIQEYSAFLGSSKTIKPSAFESFLRLAARLDSIDTQLIPENVRDLLNLFKKKTSEKKTDFAPRKYPTLDEFGRAICVGRRKMSSAKVSVVKSGDVHQGQILINSRHLEQYFPRLQDRQAIMYPLKVIDAVGKFNIFATVTGGGPTGQSSAVAHGLAKALVIHNPLLKTRLSRAKCLQRDSRVKERKKPGKPKARKSYTWVKR